jgi:hypothetical protein
MLWHAMHNASLVLRCVHVSRTQWHSCFESVTNGSEKRTRFVRSVQSLTGSDFSVCTSRDIVAGSRISFSFLNKNGSLLISICQKQGNRDALRALLRFLRER